MTVTIIAKNDYMGFYEKYEGVDYDMVEIKEIKSRKFKGVTTQEVRIDNGTKRHTRLFSSVFKQITIQDEETGRYIWKYDRDAE